ncbi:hypothetical protein [Nakamurella panacisegetis]|uniref:hypothetical protein n=1 Tax=Nakamurella panacisegetis TaxID=1090615 RepID=UPI0012FE7322|nr:hypothetical protein [Nakamurella panacisegetis]
MQTVSADGSVSVALAAEIMAGVRAVGAAVLGGTKAELLAPDDAEAPEDAGAPPDEAGPAAALDVAAADELEDELDELEPQADTTRALAAITASSAARVERE